MSKTAIHPFGQYLRERLAAKGLGRRDVQDELRVTYTTAHNWWTGKHPPGQAHLPGLAKLLDRPITEIVIAATGSAEIGEPPTPPLVPFDATKAGASAVVVDKPLDVADLGPKSVPILGVVVGGNEADFYFDGDPVGYVRKPEAISNLAEVYALFVIGTSMSPRFKDGELVYVHKRTPSIGDDVVVQLKVLPDNPQPRGFIKHLVRRTPEALVCAQYDPPMEIAYAWDEILRVDRILTLNELLGV